VRRVDLGPGDRGEPLARTRIALGKNPKHLTLSGFRRTEVDMHRRHVGPAALACLLCILISSLSLLAYAGPLDPSWVRGVYDNGDFDDVVCLIMIIANAGFIDDAATVEGRPDFVLIGAEVPRDDLPVAPCPLSSSQSRPSHPQTTLSPCCVEVSPLWHPSASWRVVQVCRRLTAAHEPRAWRRSGRHESD
jgi:hypothetical protein